MSSDEFSDKSLTLFDNNTENDDEESWKNIGGIIQGSKTSL